MRTKSTTTPARLSLAAEPVTVTSAVTGALTSTIALLLFLGVDPELVGGITVAVTAWIGVVAAIVRGRVTPVTRDTTIQEG